MTSVAKPAPLIFLLGIAELSEPLDHVFARRRDLHLLIDVYDDAFFVDVEGPSVREPAESRIGGAIGGDDLTVGIAQDRKVRLDLLLGEPCVVLDGVAAGGEIGDVELLQGFSAGTQRVVFGRSATRERFGEPGDHDPFLALVLLERVFLAVRAGHREVGRLVSDFQFHGLILLGENRGRGRDQRQR